MVNYYTQVCSKTQQTQPGTLRLLKNSKERRKKKGEERRRKKKEERRKKKEARRKKKEQQSRTFILQSLPSERFIPFILQSPRSYSCRQA